MTAKYCGECGQWKPLTEYFRDRSRRDGYAVYCKACRRARWREWYADNWERERDRKRQHYYDKKQGAS